MCVIMAKKLFVGNIDRSVSDQELQDLFAQHGEINPNETRIIKDRETGRSRGFGFVEFMNDEDADAAIQALDQYELNGRPIGIKEARPQQPRQDSY